jgi:hypothetical protein
MIAHGRRGEPSPRAASIATPSTQLPHQADGKSPLSVFRRHKSSFTLPQPFAASVPTEGVLADSPELSVTGFEGYSDLALRPHRSTGRYAGLPVGCDPTGLFDPSAVSTWSCSLLDVVLDVAVQSGGASPPFPLPEDGKEVSVRLHASFDNSQASQP